LEVIPMISRAYRATRVNDVNWEQLARGKKGVDIILGVDIGKYDVWPVCRWADGRFERPWRVKSPAEIPALIALLKQMGIGRKLVVAMESSGTYGDALRQALADAGIPVQRVGGKAAHDYAEVFDGVPSQHDGKDAAVIADLAFLGKSRPWDYQAPSPWDQELTYWVEWIVAQRRIQATWQGRLEALLARHWPEATQVLKLTSATLLRTLEQYGDPRALAVDPQAIHQLLRWGGNFLRLAKAKQLLASASSSVGVRVGEWELQQIREYAKQALAARREVARGELRLRELTEGHTVLQAQAKVVGVATACVLWSSLGDPKNYHAAAAYRKAMGLNLAERSSGVYVGQLRISKRGSGRVRQWLYFAALRLVQKSAVRPWYEAKKRDDEEDARRVVVAVMRKLALALYHVGVYGKEFRPRQLFGRIRGRRRTQTKTKNHCA
jgi:transposase